MAREIRMVSLVRLNKAEIRELSYRLEEYENITSVELLNLMNEVRK